MAAYAELVTAYPDVWVLKLDAEGELWPDNPYERDALFEVEDTSADENIAELELFDITISVRTTGAAATATQAVAVTDRPTAAPTSPELESPPDEAEDQPTSLTLEWSPSSDPDGGSVKYRVYLDTSSPPEEIAEGGQDISDNQLSVSGLLPRTTYYWMVVAVDDEGETAESETWSFTTERPSEGYLLLSQGVKYTVNQASGQATADEFLVLLTEGGDKVALEAPDGAEIVIGDGEGNDAYQVKSLGELELEYSDGPGNDAFKFLDGDDDDTVTIDDAAGEGDDSYILTFAETGSDSLTIADGDGNDRYHVGFSGATGPSFTLEIEDGPGNDRYAVRGGGAVLGGLSATFTGGEGNDRLTILNIRSTGEVGIEIQDGEGDDAYWIRNVAPLNAEGSTAAIADGEGDDVYIYRQVRGESDDDVTVADGEGKNRYTLGTGKGDDSVTVEDGEGASVYIINLGDGDDSIEVTDSDSRDVYRVNGGKGEDELALTDDFPDDGDVGKIRNVEGM